MICFKNFKQRSQGTQGVPGGVKKLKIGRLKDWAIKNNAC